MVNPPHLFAFHLHNRRKRKQKGVTNDKTGFAEGNVGKRMNVNMFLSNADAHRINEKTIPMSIHIYTAFH